MTQKIKIITISGLDGSGKSTQIDLLKKHLESQGRKVFYFHSVQFSIAEKIFGLPKKIKNFFSSKNKIKSFPAQGVIKATKRQISLRKIALKIDLKRFESLCNKLENENYDYLVSDRYFYDNLINIQYLTAKLDPHSNVQLSQDDIAKIKKPDTSIYLQVDPRNIMSRDRAPEQGIIYLELKRVLYDQAKINWSIIDGNKAKNEIFEEIKKIIY